MLTQLEYGALQSKIRHLHIKLDLLNEQDYIVDRLEGIATGGSINLSADSVYRRTGNLTMVLKPQYNLLPSPSAKLWFDKRTAISIGIESYLSSEIVWFNLGRFAISNINVTRDISSLLVNCELLDYMAFLDGTLGGLLPGAIKIEQDSMTITQAIRNITAFLPKTVIEPIMAINTEDLVPETIEMGIGTSTYDLLKNLIDRYANYEIFFDINGYLRVQRVRKRISDPIAWSFAETKLNLNDNSTMEFKNIKNSIWVWGRVRETEAIELKIRNRWARNTIADLDNLLNKEIGDICWVSNTQQSFMWDGDNWVVVDLIVEPLFNIEAIGEKIHTVENSDIITMDQALIRGLLELRERSNFAQQINFNTVPIYALGPNSKVFISSPEVGVEGEFLVTQLTLPLGLESSSITCKKIYY